MNAQEFVAQVQQAAGLERPREAERWVDSVLVALADLVPDPAARRHFITQLPGPFKGHLLAEPLRGLPMTRDALLQHVGRALHTHVPGAQRAVEAVYGVLRRAIAAGELQEFEARVPGEIGSWLATVR
jgi:uncharacterized protein (DUF2267 family)